MSYIIAETAIHIENGHAPQYPLDTFNLDIILKQGASLFSGEIDDNHIVKAGMNRICSMLKHFNHSFQVFP